MSRCAGTGGPGWFTKGVAVGVITPDDDAIRATQRNGYPYSGVVILSAMICSTVNGDATVHHGWYYITEHQYHPECIDWSA